MQLKVFDNIKLHLFYRYLMIKYYVQLNNAKQANIISPSKRSARALARVTCPGGWEN